MTLPPSSDFENKFVCGEIMSYDDLKELGSEAAVKAAGKVRQQGKPYESSYLRTYLAIAC
jgi:ribosome-binding ATPase YchF (GTP1/OBG family)